MLMRYHECDTYLPMEVMYVLQQVFFSKCVFFFKWGVTNGIGEGPIPKDQGHKPPMRGFTFIPMRGAPSQMGA